ncbi:D-alanine--D-alanine ligase [Aliamphritea hakodatensis]|uniref:D-alanine--D-alanine ligase n=1 Tax=Aliamphritea hakodatensis TaxID=2895352 RepID=UPI0022FD8055|nr:D-alanine--D-alanine ligase [Aliamphritea hakodatensis]
MAEYRIDAQLQDRFGRVAVIYGGNSAERSVSLKSGAEVLQALQNAGVNAFGLDLCGDGENLVDGLSPVQQLMDAGFDRAFLILHGRGGEDGTLQGLLEIMGKPYTGSGVMASSLGMDKVKCKQIWQGAGMPTPAYELLTADSDFTAVAERLGFPVIVKPAHEGSSIGMSKVADIAGLEAAYAEAVKYDRAVLAEQWIEGPEFTVTVINGEALPVIRLETPNDFYDFEAKYQSDDTQYHFDNELSDAEVTELQSLAVNAFNMVGCKDWGRVDVMQLPGVGFQLLEVNTLPGMTDHSLVPMAGRKAGISFEALVVKILRGTL